MKLFIGRQAWFSGKMGIYKKNVAVRISQRLYEEEEEDSITEMSLEAEPETVASE